MSDPSSGFYLWEELARSTVPVDSWDLCEVLLSKDANYPGWLLLVPRRANATEIIHLSDEEQIQLIQEISKASKLLQKVFNPDKLNVAAIGCTVTHTCCPQVQDRHCLARANMGSLSCQGVSK
ncbi:hypothetical protein O6H91_04G072300 [Diphasiastrum complanatum]|uniref:Uncharacterized protein n=1 Tax=Diphasiastrum complanatum TaxID=34168 RepID=A0ACC2DY12_DIPCM|nr:hypothetical protein O6H91_04G072300 [Diphasiastrum complanatum]